MEFKILFSDQALTDLEEIMDYVATGDPEAARQLGQSMVNHVGMLRTFPFIGPLVPKWPLVRKLLHTPYKIYYRIHTRRRVIEILHFWHAARLEPPHGSMPR